MKTSIANTIAFAVLAAATTVSFAREDNPVPANISAEAQEFLRKARTGQMPARDMSDPKLMATMRKALGGMFLKNARKIDPDLYLTEQYLDAARGFWVNSPAPADRGPVILYLHGGGHILGSAEQNLGNTVRVASASEFPILTVEYRLAPEHPFPSDVEDVLKAYRWLLNNGWSPGSIGVYGDSAGGGLTLALALAAREAGLPLPGALVVMSPSIDMTGQGDTRITLANTDPVLRTSSSSRYKMYLRGAEPTNPLASPIFGDYGDFPPVLIQTGTRELLLSDSVRLARRIRDHGSDVTLDLWDGMWHGWHDTPNLPEADAACDEIAAFFARHLDR